MTKPFEQRSGTASRLWLPSGLLEDWVEHPATRYVVVDEVLEGSVTLAVTTWPRLDRRGRLRFGSKPPASIVVDQATLLRALASRVSPEEAATAGGPSVIADRSIRVGDVFAVREARPLSSVLRRKGRAGGRGEESQPVIDPGDWVEPPIYDLTAEARDAAKLAYYAAASIPVSRQEIEARIAGELQPRGPDPFDLLGAPEREGG